jgi:hypothetical protein
VRSTYLRIAVLAIVVALLFPRDAFAYLDPGTGSLVFQTVVAALAAVAYGVRVYWGKIKGLFGRGRTKDVAHTSVETTEDRH